MSYVKASTQYKREHKADYGREKIEIIYQDQWLVVINKPSGLLSVPYPGSKVRTAQGVLEELLRKQGTVNSKHKPFVVHRLDEDTSGVLLFAKNPEIRDELQKNWQDIVKSRGYYAIVEGQMEKPQDTLVNYLKNNSLNLMYVTESKKDSKKCITHYKVMKSNKDYSLLDVNIDSGRKNQIRVQLGHIGHHIIGDDKYGEPANPIKRLGLHAYLLEFTHPYNNKVMRFNSPIPKEFQTLFPKK